MRKIIISTALLTCAVVGRSQTSSTSVPCSAISLGPMGSLNGFIPSPNDAWHQNISASPADLNSTNIINNIGASHLHHDWSNEGGYGIPYTVVDSSATPSVAWTATQYSSDSDLSLYPLTPATPIEGSPAACTAPTGDNHVIVVDKNKCVIHEMWQGSYCGTATPAWSASNGNMWDMTISEQRPYGMTSADAAGLSIFEGLVRYDEVQSGVINHALRFTTSMTRCDHYAFGDAVGAFVAPATHSACNNSGSLNIMGMRIRLKASFDISKYSAANQVILTAMKNYGMILADNGTSLFFQGTPDSRWNDDDLENLDRIANTAFEVVQMPTVQTVSNNLPLGTAPVIGSFTASSTTISAGQSVTLTANVTNGSYAYIDAVGFVRGPVTVTPATTTTYNLMVRNNFGTATASVTVTVKINTANLQINSIPAKTYGVAPFTVNATSLSSGTITYSVISGPASVSKNTVTVNGAGTVTLHASQAATATYPATTAQTTFVVNPAVPALAMVPIATKAYGSAPFSVSSTSNSSGGSSYSIASGPASIYGNSVTLTGVGSVTVKVNQTAAGNYTASSATTSFTVTTETPKLAFTPITTQTYGVLPFEVSASSPSPGAITYSVVSGPASLATRLLTLNGGGTVVLKATQSATGAYGPAIATTTFTVNATQAGVSFTPSSTTGTFPTMLFYSGSISFSGKVPPTGTVSVMDGSAVIQSFPLFQYQNGVVQGMLLTLTPGQHPLSLAYSGDSNYPAGHSAATTVAIE